MTTSFVDDDGVTRFRGRLDPATFRPARNVGQCRIDFSGVDGSSALIPFVFGQGDASFVDLAAPASPSPVAAGLYAYTLAVNQDGGGAGGDFIATLIVDDDWYSLTTHAFGSGF